MLHNPPYHLLVYHGTNHRLGTHAVRRARTLSYNGQFRCYSACHTSRTSRIYRRKYQHSTLASVCINRRCPGLVGRARASATEDENGDDGSTILQQSVLPESARPPTEIVIFFF